MKGANQLKAVACTLVLFMLCIKFPAQTITPKGQLLQLKYDSTTLKSEFAPLNKKEDDRAKKIFTKKITKYNTKIGDAAYGKFLKFIFGASLGSPLELAYESLKLTSMTAYVNYLEVVKHDEQYYLQINRIKKRNAFNEALIRDYKGKYAEMPFKPADKDSLSQIRHYLSDVLKQVGKLQNAIGMNDSISTDLIAQLKAFNNNFRNGAATRLIIRKLKNKWIRDYMWMREGSISVNPFEFTSNAFLETTDVDNEKAVLYDAFIKTAIDSLTLHAKYAKLDEFKNLLKESRTGKTQYSLKEEHDKLVKANETSLNAMINTTITINVLPKIGVRNRDIWDTVYINYLNKEVSNEYESKAKFKRLKKLERPITTDDTKSMYVYNVPSTVKLKTEEEQKAITDESNFQSAFGDVVAQSALLAEAVASLSSYSNLSEITKTLDNKPIKTEALLPNQSDALNKVKSGIKKVAGSDKEKNNKLLQREILANAAMKYEKSAYEITTYELVTTYTVMTEEQKLKIKKRNKEISDSVQSAFREHVSFVNELYDIFKTATIPADTNDLNMKEDDAVPPLYRTELVLTKRSDDAVKKDIKLKGITINASDAKKNDTTLIKSFSYVVGKRYSFTISAGFIFNLAPKGTVVQTNVSKNADGAVLIENISQPYRFVAGIHLYPWHKGLFLQDNSFLLPPRGYVLNRLSVYAGCAIAKNPLDNFYLGMGYDIVPGLKITAGPQLFRNDRVTISNNEILERTVKYNWAGFIGLNIDPLALTKALTNYNKLKKDEKK